MVASVFLSWQADTDARDGRNFIEDALKSALRAISSDAEVEPAIRNSVAFDKDTRGVPGQPPIVDTIFNKIDHAAVFVPDMTFVGTRKDGRPTPNPNVLIEYGWALRSLGHGRIVSVMNTACGEPGDDLPFDMRHLRHPIKFNLPTTAANDERRMVRTSLVRELTRRIKEVLGSDAYLASLPRPPAPPPFPAAEAKDGQARFRAPGTPIGIMTRAMDEPTDIYLIAGSAMWLRLMPDKDLGKRWSSADLQTVASRNGPHLQTIRPSGYSYLRAGDGFGIYQGESTANHTSALTFFFESGELWSIDSRPLFQSSDMARPAVRFLEDIYSSAIDNFKAVLGKLEIPPPYRWVAGIEGIKGAGIQFTPPPGRWFLEPGPGPLGKFLDDVLIESGYIEEGQSSFEALFPFFEQIFRRSSVDRPEHLRNPHRPAP